MDSPPAVNTSESLVTPSHHRPLPTPMRQHKTRCARVCIYQRSRVLFSLLVALLSCSVLAAPALATGTHGDRPAPPADDPLPWTGSALLLDLSPPPQVPQLMPPLPHADDASPSKRALSTDSNGTASDFSIPTPFDSALSNNFTTSCAKFINSMRQNAAFQKCHPFSLLLQTSSAFFDASKSTLRITQTLDATCAANATICKPIMDDYATQLLSSTACKADYDSDNPIVLQAYNGLVAYLPSYQASCLHDQDGNYCFADAVTNTTSPGDSYPYYLPVGQELPGGSRPTCNSCLKQVMSVFASYSNNATQPLSQTYNSAAQQIAVGCGSKFLSVAAAPLKSAASAPSPSLTPTITLILMFVLYFFQ